MAKEPKIPEVKDEPGAEDRFKRILERSLSTPPARKKKEQQASSRPKKGH